MTSPRIALNFQEGRDTGNVINFNAQDFQTFQNDWNSYINGPLRDSLLDGSGDELLNVQTWFRGLAADIEQFMFGNSQAVHQGTDTLETAMLQSSSRIGSVGGSA